MELTTEELTIFYNLLSNANVAVKDAVPAQELLKKLERLINGRRNQESTQEDTSQA